MGGTGGIYQAVVHRWDGATKVEVSFTLRDNIFRVTDVAPDDSLYVATWSAADIREDGTIPEIPDHRVTTNWGTLPKSRCRRCKAWQFDGRSSRQYCPSGTTCYAERMAEKQAKRRQELAAKRAAALQLANTPSPYAVGDG